jgi:hypothetical protein
VPILDVAIDVLLLAGSAVVALRADLGVELVIDRRAILVLMPDAVGLGALAFREY